MRKYNHWCIALQGKTVLASEFRGVTRVTWLSILSQERDSKVTTRVSPCPTSHRSIQPDRRNSFAHLVLAVSCHNWSPIVLPVRIAKGRRLCFGSQGRAATTLQPKLYRGALKSPLQTSKLRFWGILNRAQVHIETPSRMGLFIRVKWLLPVEGRPLCHKLFRQEHG